MTTEPPGQPAAHGGEQPPSRRTIRRRRAMALAAVVVLVLVLVGVVVLAVHKLSGVFGPSPDYSGDGYGTVTIHVQSGDSQTEIGDALQSAGVVESVGAYTRAADADPKADSIQPGYYRLRNHMSGTAALHLLLQPSALVQTAVVIPEGFTAAEIVSTIAKDTTIAKSALTKALADPSSIGLPPYCKGHVEGFLYPATYDFAPDTTATEALQAMVTRWQQEADALDLSKAAKRVGLTPDQAVTLASIVQKEGALAKDLPTIAEVFLNRIHDGMPLGSNATLAYVLGHPPTTQSDLQTNSPYNTEFDPGLPPTPIDSPGEVALRAVLHPSHGSYLYFVTLGRNGHAEFASTETGYEQLEAEANQ